MLRPAMGCLHIDDAPDDLLDALHAIARRQHGSVSQIACVLLRRAVLSPEARQGRLFSRQQSSSRRGSDSTGESDEA